MRDNSYRKTTASGRNRSSIRNIYRNNRGRKGIKWVLLNIWQSKGVRFVALGLAVMIVIITIVSSCSKSEPKKAEVKATVATTQPATELTSYKIEGVPIIPQGDMLAACETYACTMLLQSFGFDIDEFEFVDNYLVTRPVQYGVDGALYGPDMNSAYAGDVYTGYGVNAVGMAKFMNNYLKTTDKNLKAYPMLNVPLEELCETYIKNDIPVMVWATTYMQESYVFANWVVDYADEDSDVKLGDEVSWRMHEHCMVLVGFDEENYYFCDSVAGQLAKYSKEDSEKRYAEIGYQSIVVK